METYLHLMYYPPFKNSLLVALSLFYYTHYLNVMVFRIFKIRYLLCLGMMKFCLFIQNISTKNSYLPRILTNSLKTIMSSRVEVRYCSLVYSIFSCYSVCFWISILYLTTASCIHRLYAHLAAIFHELYKCLGNWHWLSGDLGTSWDSTAT